METWIQTELDSGERVDLRAAPHVRSATVGYWIGAGSRDETDAKAGISHFIEHLLFKGSSRYGALEIAEIFDEMGGELNAATSREHTVVYGRVPEHHVETALDVMGDMVFSPLFDDLDAERAVVLEEIAMYEDTPQELVHDLIGEAIFGIARARAAGDRHGRGDLDRQRRALQSHHAAFYAPANIVVAAAGSIDHDQLVSLVAALDRAPRATSTRREAADPAAARQAARSRACASSARTPSSTTSASAPPASRAPTAAASPPRSSTRSSAAPPPRGSSRRSARSAGWPTRSTASSRSTPTRGQIGIYVGTREENLAEALAIAVEQIADIAAGNLQQRRARRARRRT